MPAPRKPNSPRRGAALPRPSGQPSSNLADHRPSVRRKSPSRKSARKSPKLPQTPPAVSFGPEICTSLAAAEQREWLVTNGIGGFASGTVAGSATRRYHGLLFAALYPPVSRTLLVGGLDEMIRVGEQSFELAAHRWLSGAVSPEGYKLIQNFYLDGSISVWVYQLGPARIEKRIWMLQGENTTFIRYTLLESPAPIALELKALVNYRDFHSTTHAGSPPNEWRMAVDPVANGLRVTPFNGATPFYLKCSNATAEPQHTWYRDFLYPVERERGLDDHEDQLFAAVFRAPLQSGQSLTLVFSTNADTSLDGDAALAAEKSRQAAVLAAAGSASAGSPTSRSASASDSSSFAPAQLNQLLLAADQFIVSRSLPGEPSGKTIVAGYHWFGDWGRDTMIALPGLALTTGRPDIARQILLAFSNFVDRGMLPNNFPDAGGAPEYNTIDATLWYFEAVRQYLAATPDRKTLAQLFPVLAQIIAAHLHGTRYNIHVDPADGLLYGGGPGVQLTWMDAKIGDWVVTPRTGKPVEINALWINALETMAAFAKVLGQHAEPYAQLSAQAKLSFAKFWNPQRNCCFDVLDSPARSSAVSQPYIPGSSTAPALGHDPTLRPNQILAVSLPVSPLAPQQQKAVVDACASLLLTPYGLRTLAPGEPGYAPTYSGGPRERDAAYHQGTVWGWLLGPFAIAHHRVYQDRAAARAFLEPLSQAIDRYGLGTLPEIYDADPPHRPCGCIAQAWTVAELLRAWQLLSP